MTVDKSVLASNDLQPIKKEQTHNKSEIINVVRDQLDSGVRNTYYYNTMKLMMMDFPLLFCNCDLIY